jgi:integrase
VKDSDLAGLKTIFGWAVSNRKLTSNPATGITIKLGKPQKLRGKGLTEEEAKAILQAAMKVDGEGRTEAARRWVPWLAAYTGARVGELAQLRKQDVTLEGDHWVLLLTPEAGTIKTNEARKVVAHPHLIELGFPEFATSAPAGHLFLKPSKSGDVLGPLQGLKNRLSEFVRGIVTDPNVAPMHGFRHRFKTVGMDAGVPLGVLDAIQGHAARTAGDGYGDVTVKAMAMAMERIPRVVV